MIACIIGLIFELLIIFLLSLATYMLIQHINKKYNKQFNPWFYTIITAVFGLASNLCLLGGREFKEKEKWISKIFYIFAFICIITEIYRVVQSTVGLIAVL